MLVLYCIYGLTCRKKENFLLLWFWYSIKTCCSSAPRCPLRFGNHKSPSVQFWSRFSRSAFSLDMGSLVCFRALHHIKTSLSWSRKDSCCSPSRPYFACPYTITVPSWRHSLFGKSSQRSNLPKGTEVLVRGSVRADHSSAVAGAKGSAICQLLPCFLLEPKPDLALVLFVPLRFILTAWEWPNLLFL